MFILGSASIILGDNLGVTRYLEGYPGGDSFMLHSKNGKFFPPAGIQGAFRSDHFDTATFCSRIQYQGEQSVGEIRVFENPESNPARRRIPCKREYVFRLKHAGATAPFIKLYLPTVPSYSPVSVTSPHDAGQRYEPE